MGAVRTRLAARAAGGSGACGGLLVAAVLLLRMPPGAWLENEEHYLGAAWRRFGPDEVAAVSALADDSNHRLLFDCIAGVGIALIGFEWTHFLGRCAVVGLYGVALAGLFRRLGLRPLTGAAVVLTFIALGEQILASEWLFRSFEPKTLAYPLVLLGFGAAADRRWLLAAGLLGGATWCHFLVGGVWFVAIALAVLAWDRDRWRSCGRLAAAWLVLVGPLVAMIGLDQSGEAAATPDPAWIYSVVRNRHHVAPFAHGRLASGWYHASGGHGVVRLAALTVVAILFLRQAEGRLEVRAGRAALLAYGYLWLAVLASLLDQQHRLGKLYLFRPASLVLLLSLAIWARHLQRNVPARSVPTLALAACVLAGAGAVPRTTGHQLAYNSVVAAFGGERAARRHQLAHGFLPYPAYRRRGSFPRRLRRLVDVSGPVDVFLLDPALRDGSRRWRWVSFERLLDRPTLVAWKFVPTGRSELQEWHLRIEDRKALFRDGCPSDLLDREPSIRYLVAAESRDALGDCGQLLFVSGGLQVVEVDRHDRPARVASPGRSRR